MQYVVAGLGEYTPDNDQLGVEQVDEAGQVSSQFLTDFFGEFDAQQIFLVGGVYDVEQGKRGFVVLDAIREYRLFPFVYTSQQLPIERLARDFGLEASPLAAVADALVVKHAEVAELAAESRFAFIQFAVEYQSATQPPTEVDEDNVFLALDHPFDHFAIGHGAGVVVDTYLDAYPLGQDFGQRALFEIELGETEPRLGIDPPRDVDANVKYLTFVDADGLQKIAYVVAQYLKPLGGILQLAFDSHAGLDDSTDEVHEGKVYGEFFDVHANEIARLGIQPVQRGRAPLGRLHLAIADDVAVVEHFGNKLGGGGDAYVQLFGQVGQGGRLVVEIETYNLFLHGGTAGAFFYFGEQAHGLYKGFFVYANVGFNSQVAKFFGQ